ncbi:hypothetical protein ID866_4418 [Astraeus odoratus]|nr:hypothetical protein ID866_4418 [Astraeus odoratus]
MPSQYLSNIISVAIRDSPGFSLVLSNGAEDSFFSTLRRVLADNAFQQVIAWIESGSSFVVVDVEAFKRRVLIPYFNDLPFAHFVYRLTGIGFRTTIKTVHHRHSSVTSDGWEFHHHHFQRIDSPNFSVSDVQCPFDFDRGIELSYQVAQLLAKAQDDLSYLRQEIDRLHGRGSGRGSPRVGTSISHTPPLMTPCPNSGSDNEGVDHEHIVSFGGVPRGTSGTNSPSHLHPPDILDLSRDENPNVHILPPTPGPSSPHGGTEELLLAASESETSSTNLVLTHRSLQHSPSVPHSLRGRQSGRWIGGRTHASEPALSRSPSRTPLSPLTSSPSVGSNSDGLEHLRKLDDACPIEFSDSNLASPHWVDPSEVHSMVSDTAKAIVEVLPTHLINTIDGRLYERSALRDHFMSSETCSHLVSLMRTKTLVNTEFIKEVVQTYFQYAMLSHRWETYEPLFHNLSDGVFAPGFSLRFSKLTSFCRIAQCHGLDWAWCDTCCINRESSAGLDEAIRSMFRWYSESALTIVYFCDVAGYAHEDLMKSKWFTRGWTLQELLAPPVMRFYERSWIPCVRDPEYNHKLVPDWLYVLEKATGIPMSSLQGFAPGKDNPREKLRWVSGRLTTKVEDLGYCLYGIFDVSLQSQYGEGEKAFGRLVVELIRTTQDIRLLDWVGKPSGWSNALPANPSGFREMPLVVEGSKPQTPSSSGTSTPLWNHITVASPLCSAGDGVFEVLCFLHAVKHWSRVMISSPDRRRIGNEGVVQYSVRAENMLEFRVMIDTKHALENPPQRGIALLVARPWDPSPDGQNTDKPSIISGWRRERNPGLMQPFVAMLLVKDLEGRRYSRIPTESRIVAQLLKPPHHNYQPVTVRMC